MEREIKVLVVEDSPVTRRALTGILEVSFEGTDTPCKVFPAEDGEQAFERLEAGLLPNFIILDINLPGMNGAQVLKKLKDDERWKGIPIFPYSSLWSEQTDAPFVEHLKIVKDWYAAARAGEKSGGAAVSPVTPKPGGKESTDRTSPQLVIFIASVLIKQGFELSASFEILLNSARGILKD